MSKTLVSVCMITYGHEKFIRKAIEGVLMQISDALIELIIADDNSPDDTNRVVNEIKRSHQNGSWIKYTKHIKNKGIMPNFIWALKQCKGDYVAICDGDDYWSDSLKIQKQLSFLENNNEFVLAIHPCSFLKSDGSITKQNINTIEYDFTIKNLLTKVRIPSASIFYRNNEDLRVLPSWFSNIASGDAALILLLYQKGKFKLLKDNMSVYRQHDSGVSNTHSGTRMIHYRAYLYSQLNEYFDYKYEFEIYNALFFLMKKYMPQEYVEPKDMNLREILILLKNKIVKKLNKRA